MNAFVAIIILVSIISLRLDLVFTVGPYENTEDINTCINFIYREFATPRTTTINTDRRTNVFPQKLLKYIKLSDLVSRDATDYFNYILGIISLKINPDNENSEPIMMMNPEEFCLEFTKDVTSMEIDSSDQVPNFNSFLRNTEIRKCRMQIIRVFGNIMNTEVILQETFKNLVESFIPRGNHYASGYFLHIDGYIGAIVQKGLTKTPEEWCGLTPEKILGKKRPIDYGESSSFESRKYGGGRGSSSTDQWA